MSLTAQTLSTFVIAVALQSKEEKQIQLTIAPPK